MPRKKLEIQTTEEQLNTLYDSLKAGSPLQLALQRARISLATYYYWVAISSVVVAVKSQEEIDELESLVGKSGVSVNNVKEMASVAASTRKTGIGTFIEPSGESILKYKNSTRFKNFADEVHEIVSKCDQLRSEFATNQLVRIALSTQKKNGIDPYGAMWWLERNMPDFFAKPSDKSKNAENTENQPVSAIQVEFIDPSSTENRDRLLDVEKQILNDQKGNGVA